MATFASRSSGNPVVTANMTRIEPSHGCAAGGYKVTIHGAQLANTVNVEFGTNQATNVHPADTTVTCTAPAGPIGEVTVTCIDRYGNKSNDLPFMFEDC
jgi:hypothetical protein